jgi:hypothetical protein
MGGTVIITGRGEKIIGKNTARTFTHPDFGAAIAELIGIEKARDD